MNKCIFSGQGKKSISFLLAFFIILGGISPVFANEKNNMKYNENFFNIEGGVLVGVSDEINDYIADGSLEIPDGVESVGPRALDGLAVKRLILPASLVRLEEFALEGLGLEEVNLEKVEFIEDYSLANNNLTYAYLDNAIEIGRNAFSNNEIESLIFGSSLEKIGDSSFDSNRLTNLDFSTSPALRELPAFSFASNNIKNVDLGLVTSVDDTAFFGNNSLKLEDPSLEDETSPRPMLAQDFDWGTEEGNPTEFEALRSVPENSLIFTVIGSSPFLRYVDMSKAPQMGPSNEPLEILTPVPMPDFPDDAPLGNESEMFQKIPTFELLPLEGVEFAIYDGETQVETVSSRKDGLVVFSGLDFSRNYTVKQVSSVGPFIKSEREYYFNPGNFEKAKSGRDDLYSLGYIINTLDMDAGRLSVIMKDSFDSVKSLGDDCYKKIELTLIPGKLFDGGSPQIKPDLSKEPIIKSPKSIDEEVVFEDLEFLTHYILEARAELRDGRTIEGRTVVDFMESFEQFTDMNSILSSMSRIDGLEKEVQAPVDIVVTGKESENFNSLLLFPLPDWNLNGSSVPSMLPPPLRSETESALNNNNINIYSSLDLGYNESVGGLVDNILESIRSGGGSGGSVKGSQPQPDLIEIDFARPSPVFSEGRYPLLKVGIMLDSVSVKMRSIGVFEDLNDRNFSDFIGYEEYADCISAVYELREVADPQNGMSHLRDPRLLRAWISKDETDSSLHNILGLRKGAYYTISSLHSTSYFQDPETGYWKTNVINNRGGLHLYVDEKGKINEVLVKDSYPSLYELSIAPKIPLNTDTIFFPYTIKEDASKETVINLRKVVDKHKMLSFSNYRRTWPRVSPSPIGYYPGAPLGSNSTVMMEHGIRAGEFSVPLEGVEFSLYTADGKTLLDTQTSDIYGRVSFRLKGDKVGDYIVRETSTLDGFIPLEEDILVSREDFGICVKDKIRYHANLGEIENKKGTSLLIEKLDINSEPVKGIDFEISGKETGFKTVKTTNSSGTIELSGLLPDIYIIKELSAPGLLENKVEEVDLRNQDTNKEGEKAEGYSPNGFIANAFLDEDGDVVDIKSLGLTDLTAQYQKSNGSPPNSYSLIANNSQTGMFEVFSFRDGMLILPMSILYKYPDSKVEISSKSELISENFSLSYNFSGSREKAEMLNNGRFVSFYVPAEYEGSLETLLIESYQDILLNRECLPRMAPLRPQQMFGNADTSPIGGSGGYYLGSVGNKADICYDVFGMIPANSNNSPPTVKIQIINNSGEISIHKLGIDRSKNMLDVYRLLPVDGELGVKSKFKISYKGFDEVLTTRGVEPIVLSNIPVNEIVKIEELATERGYFLNEEPLYVKVDEKGRLLQVDENGDLIGEFAGDQVYFPNVIDDTPVELPVTGGSQLYALVIASLSLIVLMRKKNKVS